MNHNSAVPVDGFRNLSAKLLCGFHGGNLSLSDLTETIDGKVYTEKWKDIIGYKGLYLISNFGRIKILPKRGNAHTKIKIQRVTKFGYATVILWNRLKTKHFIVHCLVSKHFIKNIKNKPQVNHKDGIKLNNFFENLEWNTASENLKHAYSIGLKSQKGERHASNKLNNEQVLEIFNSKLSLNAIAKIYKIRHSTAGNIKTGFCWSHLTGKKYIKNEK